MKGKERKEKKEKESKERKGKECGEGLVHSMRRIYFFAI